MFVKYKAEMIYSTGFGSDHEGDIEKYFNKWSKEFLKNLKNSKIPDFKGNLEVFLNSKKESPKSFKVITG